MYGPLKASRFKAEVVYTNTMSAGAYRGYGATQGIFALESAMDDLADKIGMDPMQLRAKTLLKKVFRSLLIMMKCLIPSA